MSGECLLVWWQSLHATAEGAGAAVSPLHGLSETAGLHDAQIQPESGQNEMTVRSRARDLLKRCCISSAQPCCMAHCLTCCLHGRCAACVRLHGGGCAACIPNDASTAAHAAGALLSASTACTLVRLLLAWIRPPVVRHSSRPPPHLEGTANDLDLVILADGDVADLRAESSRE